MNLVISVIPQYQLQTLSKICDNLALPVVLSTQGRGTATRGMLDLFGIEKNEKWVIVAVANQQATEQLIEQEKRYLYIDAPRNGIVIVIPIKSVGGVETLTYLFGGQPKMKAPNLTFENELIVVIANEGHTDTVMDAARLVGARGGTVVHAKGTGADNAEKFFSVSIAQEKEIILIVADASQKAEIMKSVLEKAGPTTPSCAIVFSLPVSDIQGFGTKKQDFPQEQ